MKMKILIRYCLIFTMSFTLLEGCKKKEDGAISSTDTEDTSKDNALSEQSYSDVFQLSTDAMDKKGGLNKTNTSESALLNDCATVKWDSDSTSKAFPKKLTVTFSDPSNSLGCLGKDGRYRHGKIHITLANAGFRTKGALLTIALDEYYVDGHHVEGVKTLENTGLNASNNLVFKETVTGGKITKSTGGVITWESNKLIEEVLSSSVPPLPRVDYYLVTGTGSGTNVKGKAYTITILSALKVKVGCFWIVSGSFKAADTAGNYYTVDFGNGACDHLATLTYLGKDYQIQM